MQENESLREFVKRFGQAMLQVESCSMDVILQIFKRCICPNTPFFESLAKKPPAIMDDLFKQANKYSMLEDNVRATTQQVLVTSRPTKNDHVGSSKPSNQLRQAEKRWDGQQQPSQAGLTPLSISYHKLLSIIWDLSDFRWPKPIKTDSIKRDRNRKCAYHKDHDHTTEQCRSLHYLVERLIKAGHLKQYIRSDEE